MIYGATNKQSQDRYDARQKWREQWHEMFAFFPVKLKDGRHVWLQWVEERWIDDSYDYRGGYYHYRLIEGKVVKGN
jgi:hypothetical protein